MGKSGDKILDSGLLLCCGLHHLQYPGNRGVFISFCSPYLQRPLTVHTSGDHHVSARSSARNRLTGQCGGIDQRFTFHNLAVKRDPLSGADHNDLTGFDLIRVHFLDLTVPLHKSCLGSDTHQIRDRVTALACRVILEQFTDLIEKHDRDCLRVFPDTKSTESGDHHQEVLVKHISSGDIADRLQDNVITHDQIRHKGKQETDPPFIAVKRSYMHQNLKHHEQYCRNNNPGQPFFLFLVKLHTFITPITRSRSFRSVLCLSKAGVRGNDSAGYI